MGKHRRFAGQAAGLYQSAYDPGRKAHQTALTPVARAAFLAQMFPPPPPPPPIIHILFYEKELSFDSSRFLRKRLNSGAGCATGTDGDFMQRGGER